MNEKGKIAEDHAAQYLVQHGFLILERNYRCGKAEVDLIALRNDLLVFAEVKFRKNALFGHPETTLSDRKIELLHEAASFYTQTLQTRYKLRFDVIAITGEKIEHFQDAF
jgi:putative endonuclease